MLIKDWSKKRAGKIKRPFACKNQALYGNQVMDQGEEKSNKTGGCPQINNNLIVSSILVYQYGFPVESAQALLIPVLYLRCAGRQQ